MDERILHCWMNGWTDGSFKELVRIIEEPDWEVFAPREETGG